MKLNKIIEKIEKKLPRIRTKKEHIEVIDWMWKLGARNIKSAVSLTPRNTRGTWRRSYNHKYNSATTWTLDVQVKVKEYFTYHLNLR